MLEGRHPVAKGTAHDLGVDGVPKANKIIISDPEHIYTAESLLQMPLDTDRLIEKGKVQKGPILVHQKSTRLTLREWKYT